MNKKSVMKNILRAIKIPKFNLKSKGKRPLTFNLPTYCLFTNTRVLPIPVLGHWVEAKFARTEVGSYQSRCINCCEVGNEFGMILGILI